MSRNIGIIFGVIIILLIIIIVLILSFIFGIKRKNTTDSSLIAEQKNGIVNIKKQYLGKIYLYGKPGSFVAYSKKQNNASPFNGKLFDCKGQLAYYEDGVKYNITGNIAEFQNLSQQSATIIPAEICSLITIAGTLKAPESLSWNGLIVTKNKQYAMHEGKLYLLSVNEYTELRNILSSTEADEMLMKLLTLSEKPDYIQKKIGRDEAIKDNRIIEDENILIMKEVKIYPIANIVGIQKQANQNWYIIKGLTALNEYGQDVKTLKIGWNAFNRSSSGKAIYGFKLEQSQQISKIVIQLHSKNDIDSILGKRVLVARKINNVDSTELTDVVFDKIINMDDLAADRTRFEVKLPYVVISAI